MCPQVHDGKFVVAEVLAGKSTTREALHQLNPVLHSADLNTDEDLGPRTFRHPVAEFSEASISQLFTQIPETPWPLRDLHRKHRFSFLAEFSPFGMNRRRSKFMLAPQATATRCC